MPFMRCLRGQSCMLHSEVPRFAACITLEGAEQRKSPAWDRVSERVQATCAGLLFYRGETFARMFIIQ